LFVFVFVFAGLKSFITKKAADLDSLNDVAEDFTVMVTHLPSNEPDELIKKHFETLINKNIGRCKLEVESLCPAYEMKEFKKLQNNFKNANKYMAMQLNREKRQLKI